MFEMKQKNDLKNELLTIRRKLDKISHKENNMQRLIQGKATAEDSSATLLQLVKYVMEDSKSTRQVLNKIQDVLSRLEQDVAEAEFETVDDPAPQPGAVKEVPLSSLDTKIIQIIQMKNMASADDIRKAMNYKGKNAASARLHKLYKQGVIERYQLGHKVFYKYDAGKTTKGMLIVSPPQ